MKKLIFLIIFLNVALFGGQIEVIADNFEADEIKEQIEFTNNVVVTKEKDVLKAKKVVVDFDKNKKPLKYVATGDVKVNMFIKEKHYFAQGDSLTYEPSKELYILTGNAFLQEIDTDKRVYGEKISVNQGNGTYRVDGEKGKPAKFTFQIEEENI